MDAKACPWIWEGVSRTWDPIEGRYEGIHGSAPVGMLYCYIGHDGMVRGCPDHPVRYGEGCLGDIESRGWFVRIGGEGCVMRGVIVQGDAG